MSEHQLLIGGELVAGDGAPLEVENPYSEETVASVGGASPEQVDAAVAAAREAFVAWSVTPAGERGGAPARDRAEAARERRGASRGR